MMPKKAQEIIVVTAKKEEVKTIRHHVRSMPSVTSSHLSARNSAVSFAYRSASTVKVSRWS